jgi:hypothetical protein
VLEKGGVGNFVLVGVGLGARFEGIHFLAVLASDVPVATMETLYQQYLAESYYLDKVCPT